MSERKPMVLVFAGPNGSGKSTVTTYFDKVGTYTNADDIVAATGMDNMEAARLADKMRYRSIEQKEDFTFETVLSSHYKLDILKKAKEEGYFIKCFFILTVDASVNVARVSARVASGGHNVDEKSIRARYSNCHLYFLFLSPHEASNESEAYFQNSNVLPKPDSDNWLSPAPYYH